MEEIRVLIVAADPLARAGLALLLQEEETCLIVGQIEQTGADWDKILEVYRPTAVLWDLGWDSEPTEAELEEISGIGVPVLALLPNAALLEEVLVAGALGALPRQTDAQRLSTSLQAITQKLTVLDPAFGRQLAQSQAPGPNILPENLLDEAIEPLTPRETEVLTLLTEGLTNKAIGQKLHISAHTVKFHVNAIMTKLSAQSRTEAVTKATRLGLLPL